MLLMPAFFKASKYLFNSMPLVVKLSSILSLERESKIASKSTLASGSPPVSRIF